MSWDLCEILYGVPLISFFLVGGEDDFKFSSKLTVLVWRGQKRIQGGAGGHSTSPEFGFFCSYFQNSFSIACLRERKPSAKQEKYLS